MLYLYSTATKRFYMNELRLLIGWSIYFLLHSLLAANTVKAFFARQFNIESPRVYRIGYNLFGTAGLLVLGYFQFIISSDILFNPDLVSNSLAFCLMTAGIAVMVIAIKNYDWKGFSGISEETNYIPVTAGMNKYIRHPLYSGTMLFVIGFFIWQPFLKNLLLMILMWVYLVIGMMVEERKLVQQYGEYYKNYQKRVKKIIPFIW